MQIKPLKLIGAYAITLEPRSDDRGYFMRSYDDHYFQENNLQTHWVQENQSLSFQKHTIRGLHFQNPPHAETKLVRVLSGAILDVFVDLRKNSKTYAQWEAIELSAENRIQAYIPKGCAHGFCTLVENSLVFYKVDSTYSPDSEGGIRWNDDFLKINWPTETPVLSIRDSKLPLFKNFITPF